MASIDVVHHDGYTCSRHCRDASWSIGESWSCGARAFILGRERYSAYCMIDCLPPHYREESLGFRSLSSLSLLPRCSLHSVSVSDFSARYTWVKSVLDSFMKRLQAFSFSAAIWIACPRGTSLRPENRCHLHIPSPLAYV